MGELMVTAAQLSRLDAKLDTLVAAIDTDNQPIRRSWPAIRLASPSRCRSRRSGSKSEGRFGKQDFVYLADEDVYRCPAGEKLTYRFTAEEHGQKLRGYWTDACRSCPIKAQCTMGKQRRITRWEHGEVVEAVQERLDKNPNAMRTRRETVEHPFATMKMRMGATHFLMKTLPKVATEMALHVLAYNFTRVLNIFGAKPFMAAVRA
jgi:Transposase DDE domain